MRSQPSSTRKSRSSRVSTPSAMTWSFSSDATASTARVIAACAGSRAMSRTKAWSIFSALAGNWPSTARLE